MLAAQRDIVHPDEFAPPHGAFVVIRDGEKTMAGGGLRRLSDGVGEIKRIWTAPRARGRGYARRVLSVLEATAVDYRYRTLRLETASGDFAYYEKRLS